MLDYLTLDGFTLLDERPGQRPAAGVREIQGLTGPTSARGDATKRSLEDGSIEPPFRLQDGRVISIDGDLWPATHTATLAGDIDAAWERWDDLAAILVAALTTPVGLVWRRAGGSVEKTISVRLADQAQPDQREDENGPFIRYQIHLSAPDPNHYGAAKTANAVPPTSSGGIHWPIHWPLNLGAGIGGSVDVTNSGNAKTWPRFTITGPIISPAVVNATLGQGLYFDGLSLSTGDTLYVDMRPGFREASVNGSDVRSTIRWAQSRYFPISPRATESVRFYGKGGGYTAATGMRIDFADAYTS